MLGIGKVVIITKYKLRPAELSRNAHKSAAIIGQFEFEIVRYSRNSNSKLKAPNRFGCISE